MRVGDPVHQFIRVKDGVRLKPDIHLRTSIVIDGEIYKNDMRLLPGTVEDLETFLDLAEEALGRAVGRKIVAGKDL